MYSLNQSKKLMKFRGGLDDGMGERIWNRENLPFILWDFK